MDYNKRTMYNRKKRCELEETVQGFIPYAGHLIHRITDELMDDDAVKVLKAFEQYCYENEETEMKDEFLTLKFRKLIALRKLAKEFVEKLKKM